MKRFNQETRPFNDRTTLRLRGSIVLKKYNRDNPARQKCRAGNCLKKIKKM